MREKTYYILYDWETEQTCLFTNTIKDVAKFLGLANEARAFTVLSHYFTGVHKRIRDKDNHYYTAARYKESELA